MYHWIIFPNASVSSTYLWNIISLDRFDFFFGKVNGSNYEQTVSNVYCPPFGLMLTKH